MKLKRLRLFFIGIELCILLVMLLFCGMKLFVLTMIILGLFLTVISCNLYLEYNITQVNTYIDIRCVLLAENGLDKADDLYNSMPRLQKWIYNEKKGEIKGDK